MAANLLQVEPTFFGDEEAAKLKGCTAEDFLSRTMGFKDSNNWNNERTVRMALSFLREKAHYFFQESLPTLHPADDALIKAGDLAAFTRVFKQRYFKVKATTDLSTDWSKLKQRDKESAASFADRVVGTLGEYRRLIPEGRAIVQHNEAVAAAVQAMCVAAIAGDDIAVAITQQMKDDLAAAMDRNNSAYRQQGMQTFVQDLIYKVLADGLRSKPMQELVRKEECKRTALHAIIALLTQQEQSGHKVDNGPTQTSIPNAGRVAQVLDGSATDDQPEVMQGDTIQAVQNTRGRGRGGRRGQRGTGRGNGGRGHQSNGGGGGAPANHHSNPTSNGHQANGSARPASQTRKGGCHFCGEEGHWIQTCPVKNQMLADRHRGQRVQEEPRQQQHQQVGGSHGHYFNGPEIPMVHLQNYSGQYTIPQRSGNFTAEV